MNKGELKLHIERRRIIVIVLSFSFLCLLANLLVMITIGEKLSQFETLSKSKYLYSAEVRESTGCDDYYSFNAVIPFGVSATNNNSVNAGVVMQTEDSKYSNIVDWNTEELDISEIAVSRELANKYSLQIGDLLYSKHIVDGEIRAYTIREVLPSITDIRKGKGNRSYDGLIIMGYDSLYEANITNHLIAYTENDVKKFSDKYNSMPSELVYRDDEMIYISKQVIPYIALFMLAEIIIAVLSIVLLTKDIRHNFHRFIVLGFRKCEINRAYNRFIVGCGLIEILIGFLTAILFAMIFSYGKYAELVILYNTVLGCLGVVVSSACIRKRFWRN